MNEILEMRSFGENRRAPTVEKVRKDGNMMYYHARYVIVLNENGEIVEEVIHERKQFKKKNRLSTFIVVLAPVVYKGKKINHAVVLEIGLSASTPYTRFEFTDNEKRNYFAPRTPVARLSNAMQIRILPDLFRIIQLITDEELEHREKLINLPRTEKYKFSHIELRGKSVTIPKEDEVLIYTILELDMEFRRNTHIKNIVGCIKRCLHKVKPGEYSEKELKKIKGAVEVAEYMYEAKFIGLMLDEIRQLLGKPTNKYRHLFEQILEVFKIKPVYLYEVSHMYERLHHKWSDLAPRIRKLNVQLKTQPKKDGRRVKLELKRLETTKDRNIARKRKEKTTVKAKGYLRVIVFPSLELVRKKYPEHEHRLHGQKLKRMPSNL